MRYQLLELSDPALRRASVLNQDDGDVEADELALVIDQCREVGIPEPYAPRVAVVSRRHRPKVRVYSKADDSDPQQPTVTMTPADPRSLNVARRARVQLAAKFIAAHIDHEDRFDTVGMFQGRANRFSGVRAGHRDRASAEQLARMEAWMLDRIREHCETHHEDLPTWVRDEEQEE
jgi:hypothetical protein